VRKRITNACRVFAES